MFAMAASSSNSTAAARSHLCDYRHVGAVEDRGILQRLILAFRHRQQHQTKIFPQVIGGRAYQIADILDEEKVERPTSHPSRARWTIAASRWQSVPVVICFTGRLAARQADCIVLGGQVANQRRYAICPARSVRVFSRNAVLPAPGLETRLTTKVP